MDKKDLVRYIKENRRFPRDFSHYTDYVICMSGLSFIVIGCGPILNLYKHPNETILLLFSLILIPFGSWLLYNDLKKLKRNLTFEIVNTTGINFDYLVDKINSVFNLKHIEPDKELGLISAYTKTDWFSWGEKLTLVIEKDHVLINSRPVKQPVTIRADKNNILRMRQLIMCTGEVTKIEKISL